LVGIEGIMITDNKPRSQFKLELTRIKLLLMVLIHTSSFQRQLESKEPVSLFKNNIRLNITPANASSIF
jgi:hypothetical protein